MERVSVNSDPDQTVEYVVNQKKGYAPWTLEEMLLVEKTVHDSWSKADLSEPARSPIDIQNEADRTIER